MAIELVRRDVTHVVMEASGVYTEPVYYALCEQDFTQIAVINPAHAKALKGHKTDAKDCARLAELFECGLLHGSYIPAPELKEVRDLTRYRIKTVQARTSEIQRLGKSLESAGIKLGSVASEITGKSATAMRHRAWLACRSPEGLRRCRMVLPEEAGIGAAAAQVGPGGFGAEPFGVVPGGDQEQRGGVGADAVQGEQAGACPVTRGMMSASRQAIWPSRNSARRPSSRSAIRVW